MQAHEHTEPAHHAPHGLVRYAGAAVTVERLRELELCLFGQGVWVSVFGRRTREGAANAERLIAASRIVALAAQTMATVTQDE